MLLMFTDLARVVAVGGGGGNLAWLMFLFNICKSRFPKKVSMRKESQKVNSKK